MMLEEVVYERDDHDDRGRRGIERKLREALDK
jgi:hypothetical protein